MTTRRSRYTLLALVCSVSLAGMARAQEHVVPSHVYTEFGVGVEWVNLPEVTAYFSPMAGNEFGGTDDQFLRQTAEAVFGFADPDGLHLADPFGQNARLELRIRYSEGKSDNADATLQAGGMVSTDFTTVANFPARGQLRSLTNTSLQTWDVGGFYETDVVLNDVLIFTPSIGLVYSRLDLANDFKLVQDPFLPAELNDEITAHYYGGGIGGNFSVRPIDWFRFDFGLQVDLMGVSANLDSDQKFLFGPLTFNESDDDTNFAPRFTGTAGIQFDWKYVSFGIEGQARYLGYLPVADHPTNTVADRASNIDGDDLWSIGGMGRLTIWWPVR